MSENLHHDVKVAPDGTIYALAQEFSEKKYPELPQIKSRLMNESVAVIAPHGEVKKKIYIIDAFLGTPFAPLLRDLPYSDLTGDYLQLNSVEIIGRKQAARFPFAKTGHRSIRSASLPWLRHSRLRLIAARNRTDDPI